MAKKKKRTATSESKFWYLAALIGLMVLLFYPPFFRGLFFEADQQWTLFLASFVFLACYLWQISKNKFDFFYGYQGYLVFSLLLVYIVACFGAANMRLAVAEVVKLGIYFCVFWTSGRLVTEGNGVNKILGSLYFSGVCVAFAGFLAAVEILNIHDGFVKGRMYSTLQYPNALAIFLISIAIFGFYFWLTSQGSTGRLLLSAGNFILLFSFVSTNSRGGFLVAAGMLGLFFLGLPREMKWPWLGHLALVVPVAVFCSGKVISSAYVNNFSAAWFWFIVCLVIAVVLQWLSLRLAPSLGVISKPVFTKKAVALVLICVIAAAGTAMLWGNQNESTQASSVEAGPTQAWYLEVLPDHIAYRLSDFNLETRNAQVRLFWFIEAFDLIRHSPVFGLGGGAWEAAYRAFQDYPYTSTQIHNHFLQVWVEVGTIGFILYLAIWVVFFVVCYRNFRSASTINEKLLDLGIFVSGVGLGVHSFIDFDLSLSAVAIVLWVCFGLAWGRSSINKDSDSDRNSRRKTMFVTGVSLLTFFFLVLSGSLSLSNLQKEKGIAMIKTGNVKKAEERMLKALQLDPFSPDIKATLASLKNAQNKKQEAVEYMNEAIAKSPYDYKLFSTLSGIYLNNGDLEQAMDAGRKAVAVAPWHIPAYQSLTDAYVQGGIELLEEGNEKGATELFLECVNLPAVLEKNTEEMPQNAQELWVKREGFFNLNPRIKLNIGVSHFYLKDYSKAEVYLKQAYRDEKIKPLASFWLGVLKNETRETAESQKYFKEADQDLVKQFSQTYN